MRLAIRHTTHYNFGQPVNQGLQRLRLTPKKTQGQTIVDWKMHCEGARQELEYDDQNINHVTLISLEPGTRELVITCEGTIETQDNSGIFGTHSGHMPLWSFCSQTDLTRPGPRMKALLANLPKKPEDTLELLHALSAEILENVAYEAGHTDAGTTAEEAVAAGHGVCQDHAHIFIGLARALEVPARYVSGYLMLDDRVEQDAAHAWAEAHVRGLGWVGFDISNGISPDERYVRVATGRDYREAAPLTGINFGSAEEVLHVELAVEQQTIEQ